MNIPSASEVEKFLGELGCNEQNQITFKLLIERLQEGQGIVPFVGAGLTANLGYPTWTDFFKKLSSSAGRTDITDKFLEKNEYEEAAEDLYEALGHMAFEEQMQAAFGHRGQDAASLQSIAVNLLPYLVEGPVITTNFDRCIEKAFEECGRPFEHVVRGVESIAFVNAIKRNSRLLLKVHGCVSDSESRVLTRKQYASVYGGNAAQKIDHSFPLPDLLGHLLVSRTLLILGCSLEQDRTVVLLKSCAEKYRNSDQFAIVPQSADNTEFRKRQQHLSNLNIHPIWYPKKDHGCVRKIVQFLCDIVDLKDRPKTNLPKDLWNFIGRVEEVKDICAKLQTTRLLTLLGMGGCGKTRLAYEVGKSVLEDFKDGVWCVQFAGVKDPNLINETIALALNHNEPAVTPPLQFLPEFLRNKKMLLIFDNCEHLVGECGKVIHVLLEKSVSVTFLITSQRPLNLFAETIHMVKPLTLPNPKDDLNASELQRYDSTRYFIERCRDRGISVDLKKGNEIGKICNHLDGIPLALELAVGRMSIYSLEQLSSALQDRFKHLRDKNRFKHLRDKDSSVREYHKTLEETLDWSYSLLSKEQQRILRRCSIFADSWNLEQSSEVIFQEKSLSVNAEDLLSELVNYSLIVRTGEGEEPRFSLLESVGFYLQARVKEAGEEELLALDYCKWMAQLVQKAEPLLLGENQKQWMSRLAIEEKNIYAAINRCMDRGWAEFALEFAGALWRFWETRGKLSEGRRKLEQIIGMPNVREFPAPLGKALSGAGMLAYRQGDAEPAHACFLEALQIAKDSQNNAETQKCLNDMGLVCGLLGDTNAAREYAEQALATARLLKNSREIAVCLNNLGILALNAEHYEETRKLLDESVELFGKQQDRRDQSFPLFWLGILELQSGEARKALVSFWKSYSIRKDKDIDDIRGLADCLFGLAKAEILRKDYKLAAIRIGQSSALRRQLNDKGKGLASTFETFALLSQLENNTERAVIASECALTLRKKSNVARDSLTAKEQDLCMKETLKILGKAGWDSASEAGRELVEGLDEVHRVMEEVARAEGVIEAPETPIEFQKKTHFSL